MNRKNLVAYFSATGTTKAVAEKVAAAADADLFEIRPVKPYTSADLDWTNKKSRSSLEMSDPSSRPAVADKLEGFAEYDAVLIGFPIWWYTAPSIINTFMGSYDFSGKRVILFATSGGSGIDRASNNIAQNYHANVVSSKMLTNASDAEIKSWISKLGL